MALIDPREDSARERAEEREMEHEAKVRGLSHVSHLPKDWKKERAEREKRRTDKG